MSRSSRPYPVWGEQYIDPASLDQMDRAVSLPVAVAGALMPDAQVGYGLPIGGVLATRGVVIPYAVGVDIACRMRLTIFPDKPQVLRARADRLKKVLLEETLFGTGGEWKSNARAAHPVLDEKTWMETKLLRTLLDKASRQLGTSGSGNHFVEWGEFDLAQDDAATGLKAGAYLALLSHSGSRGVGYQIADYYSRLAMELRADLDKELRHLAWLDLKSNAGQEYWLSMELAGRFAAANHEIIHQRVAKAAGLKPLFSVENHHNFAWKEKHHGEDVIVHRKGATPAAKGVLGIIPGSMGDPGFLVRGKGHRGSLNSAAHGAGRVMSRRAAFNSLTKKVRNEYLLAAGVTLLGGDLDESPQAYKRIEEIMAAQEDLIEVVGRFMPRIVRMDESGGKGRRED